MVVGTCIHYKLGFFSGAGKADEPVWVVNAIVLGKYFNEMPLIIPS